MVSVRSDSIDWTFVNLVEPFDQGLDLVEKLLFDGRLIGEADSSSKVLKKSLRARVRLPGARSLSCKSSSRAYPLPSDFLA